MPSSARFGCRACTHDPVTSATGHDDNTRPATLHLTLLGAPQVSLNGRTLRFKRRSALALLIYLAVTGIPASRAQLAALVADEQSCGRARLRNSLAELRASLGAHLHVAGDTIRLCPALAVSTDVAAFEVAFHTTGDERISLLQDAVHRFSGEFLEGFTVSAAYAFEVWQYFERERLHVLLLRALDDVCYACWRAGQLDSALRYARRILDVEPWHEGAHRAVMLLLAQSGLRAEALTQYETCRQTLAAEFGTGPSPETEALYQRIVTLTPTAHNLPPEPTPFIGRVRELAVLQRWLESRDTRVLAITGTGGIGKTRLALHVAARYACATPAITWLSFPDGVTFVALDALATDRHRPSAPSVAAIYGAIAAALELEDPSSRAVQCALRERTLLLVLDNVEHLAGAHQVIEEIAAAAPGVRLLVTSRGDVAAAQRTLALGPLTLPRGATDLEQADASLLFLQQARQAQLTFMPDAAERAMIAQICVAAHGLPLAIMHAAQMVRTQPCSAIAAMLRDRPLEIGCRLRNVPRRHRSLHANMQYAWNLLDPAQQRATRRQLEHAGSGAGSIGAMGAATASALASVGLLIQEPDGAPAILPHLRAFLAEGGRDGDEPYASFAPRR